MGDRIKQQTTAEMAARIAGLRAQLQGRALVFVGLMGAGKSTIGKQIAQMLDFQFFDADCEIEAAAQMSITELFAHYGEQEFRDLERRVIARLLQQKTLVLATGGGAFMNAQTRANIQENAISIWLKADLDILMERVLRKNTRPLLQNDNPRGVMENLMRERYPVYAQADITVISHDGGREEVVMDVLDGLERYLLKGKQA